MVRKNIKQIVVGILISGFLVTNSFAKEGDLWQTTGNATVRKESTANSEVVSYLKQGVVLEEIEQQGRWIKVKSQKGTTGWVHKSVLSPVTKELKTGCEGVQGFSAVCPIQKDVKVPQGAVVNNPVPQVGNTPKVNQMQAEMQKQPQVGIPPLPQNVPLPKAPQATMPEKAVSGQQQQNVAPSIEKMISGDHVEIDQFMFDKKQDTFAGNSYMVTPEKTTMVKMSSSDVNRIVCPVDIKDVVYSEEKGVQVKISGKNAFVKFLIKKLGGKETYSNIPADMYVVCGDRVYNIIAMPERIPSVNIYLEDKEQKIKDIVEKNSTIPYEKKIVNYVKDFMSGKIPPEATYSSVDKEYRLYQDLEIKEKGNYVIEGEGFTVRVFYVTGKKYGIEIKEKDFLRKEITQNPLAISLDKLKLNQGDRAILLIIEKTRG